jgi:hypothetical protein
MLGSKRSIFGKYAAQLALISISVNFTGFFTLGMAIVVFGFSFMADFLVSMSFMINLVFKSFISFIGPAIGMVILGRQKTTMAAVYYFVIGALTIPPLFIGGAIVYQIILGGLGILPFLPHIIGGILLIITGILAALWVPAPGSLGTEPISAQANHTYTSPVGTQPQCPQCGHGLFGDEQYCPGCAYDLTTKEE